MKREESIVQSKRKEKALDLRACSSTSPLSVTVVVIGKSNASSSTHHLTVTLGSLLHAHENGVGHTNHLLILWPMP